MNSAVRHCHLEICIVLFSCAPLTMASRQLLAAQRRSIPSERWVLGFDTKLGVSARHSINSIGGSVKISVSTQLPIKFGQSLSRYTQDIDGCYSSPRLRQELSSRLLMSVVLSKCPFLSRMPPLPPSPALTPIPLWLLLVLLNGRHLFLVVSFVLGANSIHGVQLH